MYDLRPAPPCVSLRRRLGAGEKYNARKHDGAPDTHFRVIPRYGATERGKEKNKRNTGQTVYFVYTYLPDLISRVFSDQLFLFFPSFFPFSFVYQSE